MKFQPQHFPVGTVFELLDESVQYVQDGQSIFTCTDITQNGVRSFVLKTGRTREGFPSDCGEGFNIDHVKRIITRGNLGVKTDYGYFATNGPNTLLKKDVAMSSIPCKIEGWPQNVRFRKGYHYTLSIDSYVMEYINRTAPRGLQVDYSALLRDVQKKAWFVRIMIGRSLHVSGFDKKRLRKWIDANLNRYLCPVNALERREEEQARAAYEADMDALDRDLEARYPEEPEVEGSSFDVEYNNPNRKALFNSAFR